MGAEDQERPGGEYLSDNCDLFKFRYRRVLEMLQGWFEAEHIFMFAEKNGINEHDIELGEHVVGLIYNAVIDASKQIRNIKTGARLDNLARSCQIWLKEIELLMQREPANISNPDLELLAREFIETSI